MVNFREVDFLKLNKNPQSKQNLIVGFFELFTSM